MIDLTPAQSAVVTEVTHPVLVHAGPGSGKTRTLVAKFVHLTATGTPFDRVLALTFSKKAATEMRHRIEEQTRRSYGRLWVSTFHSFGHTLLQQFAPEAGVPRTFRLLTGFKEWVLVRDVLAAHPEATTLAAARELRGLVGEVANTISHLKHNLVTPDALLALAGSSATPALVRDLATIYRAYEAELLLRRHLDYRDLIVRTKRLLEDSSTVRLRVQSWFDAVILDELQDVDLSQVALLAALVQGSPLARHVTACGDVNQSIYGFRGAVPKEALARLTEVLEDARTRTLDHNFRAAPALQALSRRVLRAEPVATAPEAAPHVHVRVTSSGLSEATAIARDLRRLHRRHRWRDMAVLCRSIRRDGKAVENELERLGIPYRVHGNASFYRNAAVSFLVNYILALVDEEDDTPLRRVLASPIPKLPSVPLARFLDRVSYRGRHAGRYLWFLRFLMEREDPVRFRVWRPDKASETESEEELSREREEKAQIRPPYFFTLMSVEEKQAFFEVHERYLLLRARARRAKDALPALVAAIATRSGLIDWILEIEKADPREGARLAANLSKLHSMVEEYTEIAATSGRQPLLQDLGAHLKELLEHFSNESEVDAPDEDLQEPEDAVSVMTVHQSKGLEFDVVFVPALVTGHFPTPPRPAIVLPELRPTDTSAHLVEERRLFYVALTRARHEIHLSWARRYAGDEEEAAPSPFLLEALGGTEQAFWKAAQDSHESHASIVGRLAADSASPRVTFVDDEVETDGLEEATTKDELEIALRRLHARGDEETRASVTRALAAPRATALDRAFILSEEAFPKEERRPLGLVKADIKLSASRLGEYRECPRKFFYSKLLHLEPGSSSAARFGTAVHEALEAFHGPGPLPGTPSPAERGRAGEGAQNSPSEAPLPGSPSPAERGRAGEGALPTSPEVLLRGLLEGAITAGRDTFPSEFQFRRALAEARAMVGPYLAMLKEEPLRFVVGREVDIDFEIDGVPLIAKIDRIGGDASSLEGASEIAITDYKTVNEANSRGLTLHKSIVDGKEIQLVTYYQAFAKHYGRAPSYLGKIFLKHRSAWRPGTLQVLLKVTNAQPEKGDDFRGRRGQKWTDRAWISPAELDDAWAAIREEIRAIFRPERDHFAITPSLASCKYCGFQSVCGKEEHVSASDQ